MYIRKPRISRCPVLSLLALALASSVALPALAADPACLVWDPATQSWVANPALDTNQGTESGVENTTCSASATTSGYQNNASGSGNAYGWRNFVAGTGSSAFGSSNSASGPFSNAFGYLNIATGTASNAFGYKNDASGNMGSAFGYMGEASGTGSIVLSGWYDLNGDGVWNPGETSTASGAGSVAVDVLP